MRIKNTFYFLALIFMVTPSQLKHKQGKKIYKMSKIPTEKVLHFTLGSNDTDLISIKLARSVKAKLIKSQLCFSKALNFKTLRHVLKAFDFTSPFF